MPDLLTANDRPGAYPPSWYAASTPLLDPFAPLTGDVRADVCVVGAGYTGLSAALHLAEAGLDVTLLDAHRVGWGASGRNGGQVGSGQRQDQAWLERSFGTTRARALWDMAEEAKRLVRNLAARYAIACDLRDGIVHAAHKPGHVADLHDGAEKLARDYGYDKLDPLDRAGLAARIGTRVYHGGIVDRGGAHLHPLAFALGLARTAASAGVRIHESSRVTRIDPGDPARVVTGQGAVSARFVVLACNGYLGDLSPEVATRVLPINNFIVATAPLAEDRARALIPADEAVADTRFVPSYYRLSADRRLLFGGGETYGYRFPADIAALVRPRLVAIYPQLADLSIDHAWGGTLAITPNRVPVYRRPAPNVLSASGYSGHGVALATLAGRLMADAIRGTAERFDLLASLPQPRFPGGARLRAPLLALAMSWYALRDRL